MKNNALTAFIFIAGVFKTIHFKYIQNNTYMVRVIDFIVNGEATSYSLD